MSECMDAVQALAKLRDRYLMALPEKVDTIEGALKSFFSLPWEEEACTSAHRLLHSLAGSAGTYGLIEIGRRARLGEIVVERSCEYPPGKWGIPTQMSAFHNPLELLG